MTTEFYSEHYDDKNLISVIILICKAIGLNFSTKTDFAFIFLLKDPLTMLVILSHVVLSLVIIDFIQHLAGKLILWNKSVVL